MQKNIRILMLSFIAMPLIAADSIIDRIKNEVKESGKVFAASGAISLLDDAIRAQVAVREKIKADSTGHSFRYPEALILYCGREACLNTPLNPTLYNNLMSLDNVNALMTYTEAGVFWSRHTCHRSLQYALAITAASRLKIGSLPQLEAKDFNILKGVPVNFVKSLVISGLFYAYHRTPEFMSVWIDDRVKYAETVVDVIYILYERYKRAQALQKDAAQLAEATQEASELN